MTGLLAILAAISVDTLRGEPLAPAARRLVEGPLAEKYEGEPRFEVWLSDEPDGDARARLEEIGFAVKTATHAIPPGQAYVVDRREILALPDRDPFSAVEPPSTPRWRFPRP